MQKGVKIAIGGKGGVGKTTVSAVLAQLFAEDGLEVMVVDADSDTNLCSAFGIGVEESPEPLIKMKSLIGERTGTGKNAIGAYFKLNPHVSDLPEQYWHVVDCDSARLKLLVLGSITRAGAGCACPEGAFLKALLTHSILERDEVVLVDLGAGVESMGRACITGIDALIVVVEPGKRSIDTALNISQMGKQLGVKQIFCVINKVRNEEDLAVIKGHLKDIEVLCSIDYNNDVQQSDLDGGSVYESSDSLVEKMREAKDTLNRHIEEGVND